MEPAEKAGSGEITIAISRSILSNKHSKAVRRMPDGLAGVKGNELLQSKPDGFASSLWEGASGAPANFAL